MEKGYMFDKKAIAILKKYYLPYRVEDKPSEKDFSKGVETGVLIQKSITTHDEMISEIKELANRILLESAAKAFLYSLSSGDMRYRSALSSLIWARSLPNHSSKNTERINGKCLICGCTHGLDEPENIDWNDLGVFRYLPPKQYGKNPNYLCPEYVLNDLREFEKLPSVEPKEEDYNILNGIFATIKSMKSHNMDTAVVSEIRGKKIIDATGNGVHCILAILSNCSILENEENKGFLHEFINCGPIKSYRDDLSFYPLYFWKGRDGINYDAVREIFGSFDEGKLTPENAKYPDVIQQSSNTNNTSSKRPSKDSKCFKDNEYFIMLTDEERRYLALDSLNPSWEKEILCNGRGGYHNRMILFYEADTIVKVIHEECGVKDEKITYRNYTEFDTKLATDNRNMILPQTSRGRAKKITISNVLAIRSFGCNLYISMSEESKMFVWNPRNNQDLAVGEIEKVSKIKSDKDFHEFMNYYISTCPDDYLDRVNEIRTLPHQTVKFGFGDIFRCQIDRNHYTYGLIIAKTRELEKWPELPTAHIFRELMDQPLIIRMYDFVTTDKNMTVEQLQKMEMRPPEFYVDADIIWGTHKIIGHKKLDVNDIQFNVNVGNHFFRYDKQRSREPDLIYIEWGFAFTTVPWDDLTEELRELLSNHTYHEMGPAFHISGKYCGKTLSDILKESSRNLLQYNLLFPENRDKFNSIMNFLGLPEDCNYDDFVEKFGGISRQQFIDLLNERCKCK